MEKTRIQRRLWERTRMCMCVIIFVRSGRDTIDPTAAAAAATSAADRVNGDYVDRGLANCRCSGGGGGGDGTETTSRHRLYGNTRWRRSTQRCHCQLGGTTLLLLLGHPII